MLAPMNTPQKGQFRWMIFKDKKDWVGSALEFNIVVTGSDPRVVEAELNDAVMGYLESAKKVKGLRNQQINAILNQTSDAEYEARWADAQKTLRTNTSIPSPLSANMYKFGIANLATA